MTGTTLRGNVYANAIEALTELAARTGAVPSIQEIADHMGVCRDRIDQLFPSIQHLLVAMAESAMMVLNQTLIDCVAAARRDDPVAQFLAIANGYVEWAHRHPREFRIVGSMPAGNFEGNERLMRYEASIHELMIRLLQRAQASGLIARDQDLVTFVSVAHTFAYGVASKMLLGDLARWNPGSSDIEAARTNMRVFILHLLRPSGHAVA